MNTKEIISRKLAVIKELAESTVNNINNINSDISFEEFTNQVNTMKELNKELSEMLLIIDLTADLHDSNIEEKLE